MTPKEKAIELVDKFKYISYDLDDIENHKEGALIAVDEILDEILEIVTVTSGFLTRKYIIKHINYYQEVKQKIEKL